MGLVTRLMLDQDDDAKAWMVGIFKPDKEEIVVKVDKELGMNPLVEEVSSAAGETRRMMPQRRPRLRMFEVRARCCLSALSRRKRGTMAPSWCSSMTTTGSSVRCDP